MNKTLKYTLIFASIGITALISCEKATVYNPNIDEENMGLLKIENVDMHPYAVTVKKSNSNKTYFHDTMNFNDFEVVEAAVGEYEIDYVQASGYLLWPTKGSVKSYVSKNATTTTEIPK